MAELNPTSSEELTREIEALRFRLAETEEKLFDANELICAIQTGEVDAVIVSGPDGEQVFTLKGAEYSYRSLVETMNEGAATLSAQGAVLYCNQRLADLIGIPLEQMIGSPVADLVAFEDKNAFNALFELAKTGDSCKDEFDFQTANSKHIPVYVSFRQMTSLDSPALCMVVTDLSERKRKDELIAAGRLASSILESAAEAIAVCDHYGSIIRSNQALEDLCGFNPLFQRFESALRLTLDEGPDERTFSIAEALSGKTFRAQEVSLRLPERDAACLLLTAAPILSSSVVVGCVLTMTDITDRKRTEEELRRQADMLRLSFDAIIVWRVGGTIESWNRGAEQLYGYCEREAVGRVTHELFRTIHETPWAEVEAVLREKGHWEGELVHFTKEGRAVTVSARHQLIVGADGVERILETNRNVTEQRQAEEKLRLATERFKVALRGSPIVVFNQDLDLRYTWIYNPAAGYADVLGKRDIDIVERKEDGELIEGIKREVIRTGVSRSQEVMIHADGVDRYYDLRVDPLLDPGGHIVGVNCASIDVTDRKQTEQILLRSEKLASVGRMASTIAHEINNPLETIGNAIYLASSDPGIPSEAKSYLNLAVQELARVTHITKQTLAFHRESNAPRLIDLKESAVNILSLFSDRLRSRGITVETDFVDVEPVRAFGAEIQQVISNLLSNSMDAVPRNGRIRLRISPVGAGNGARGVRLTIADTGAGISRERHKKIFEPFYTTKEMYGTGLGLWVTKQIVDKHGAKIRVRSKAGQGTVFTVTFPVQSDKGA